VSVYRRRIKTTTEKIEEEGVFGGFRKGGKILDKIKGCRKEKTCMKHLGKKRTQGDATYEKGFEKGGKKELVLHKVMKGPLNINGDS